MTHLITPAIVGESLAETSTTGTAFVQKTTVALTADTNYLIYFSAEFDINNSNRDAEMKLELSNTTVLRRYIVPGGTSGTDQWYSFEGSFILECGPAASPFLDMDFRMIVSFGSDEISVKNARIIAYELDVDA
jgi:hypothetical protein